MTTSKPTTFAPLCEAFIATLAAAGKSASTVKSYAGDLALARKHFGDDTPISKLTKKAVDDYFASDAVNLTRKGAPKNKITTDKIKRVFRLAMVWAEAEGLIKTAPLPTSASSWTRKVSRASWICILEFLGMGWAAYVDGPVLLVA